MLDYLEKVKQVLISVKSSGLTSEEVAYQIVLSRTIIRQNLEHLVSKMILDVDISYWEVGRLE